MNQEPAPRIIQKCGFCLFTEISCDPEWIERNMKNHLKLSHGVTNVKKYSEKLA